MSKPRLGRDLLPMFTFAGDGEVSAANNRGRRGSETVLTHTQLTDRHLLARSWPASQPQSRVVDKLWGDTAGSGLRAGPPEATDRSAGRAFEICTGRLGNHGLPGRGPRPKLMHAIASQLNTYRQPCCAKSLLRVSRRCRHQWPSDHRRTRCLTWLPRSNRARSLLSRLRHWRARRILHPRAFDGQLCQGDQNETDAGDRRRGARAPGPIGQAGRLPAGRHRSRRDELS